MQEVIKGVFIGDYKQTMHLSFKSERITNYTNRFVCKGQKLDGKMFIKQIVIPVDERGVYGKTKKRYGLLDAVDDFKTIEELINFYNN